MKFALSLLLCVLLCGSFASAQITPITSGALLSPQVLDFDTAAPAAGVIGANNPYFTAVGLCNVAIINNPGMHVAGTDVLSSGGTPLTSCLASVNNQLAIVAPNGAMDDHTAGAGWAFRLAPGTIATQFGLTVVDQVNHNIVVETYVGGVLQNSLTVTTAAAFPNPPLFFEDVLGFDEIRFMNAVANGGWGIDDLTLANVLGTPGTCPPAPANPYQVNQVNANLDIDGVMTSGFSAAVTTAGLNQSAVLTLDSALPGTPFELVVNVGSLIPSALVTAGQQSLNANIGLGAVWLNGGGAPVLSPFPGAISIPVSAPAAITAHAQGVFIDPSNVDFFSLSQGSELRITPCISASSFDNLVTGLGLESGWTNASNGSLAWTVQTGGTTSLATGPSAAFSGPNYLYCETSVAHPAVFSFDTCGIDVSSLSVGSIDFQLSRIGAAIATLEVQIDDGLTGTFVTLPGGTFTGADAGQAQGAVEWTATSVPLIAIANASFSVRFLYSGTTTFTGDIAIDDLIIN